MVPEGWKKASFREILKLDRGSSPRPIVNYMTDSLDGVNWVKIGDTKNRDLYIDSTKEKITPEGAKKSRKVSKGEIILSNSMSFGKPYILNIDGYIHDGWFVIRRYEEHLKKEFLIQVLSSELIQRQYQRLAAGGVVSNISSDLVYAVKIKLPPLPEQKKIAQILSTWDQAITATERLLENSQQRKKGLMQQLLTGKKRLPGFEGEWVTVRLGDLVEISSGSSKAQYIDHIGDKYIIDMGSVTRTGRLVPTKKTSLEGPYLAKGQLVMPKDDIGGGNIIGRVGVIPENEKYLLADHVYALTPHETDSQFLGYLINSEKVNKSLRRRANGTAQLGLGKKDVQKQALFIPSDTAEQRAIGEILLSTDHESDLLSQRLNMLKQEKKALMQQLLTGKRRVQVDTEAA